MKTSYNDPTDSEIVVSDFAWASSVPLILMHTRFLGPKKPRKWCTLDSHNYGICFYWFVSLEIPGQLLAEVGNQSLGYPHLKNCQIHMFVVVACCKITIVNELHSRKKTIHFPNLQHYKSVFWVHWCRCSWLYHCTSICKMLCYSLIHVLSL